MTASLVESDPRPIALKTLLICTPLGAPIERATLPRIRPAWSNTSKRADTAASPGLKAPAFVRKPRPGPPLAIWPRNVIGCAADAGTPGTNMPTVGCGDVE